MDRFSSVVISGITYRLTYTVGAMIELTEMYGSINQFVKQCDSADYKKRVEMILAASELLSRQSHEIAKIESGEELPIVSAEKLMVTMLPFEYPALENAVFEAITKGQIRDIEDFEDTSKNVSSGTE